MMRDNPKVESMSRAYTGPVHAQGGSADDAALCT